MIYKIVKTKIVKVYEYYYDNIAVTNGLTSAGVYGMIVYTNHGIHKRFVKNELDKTTSYIKSDYNITQGSVVDGLLIEKVEICNGEIILYSTCTSENTRMIGKSKKQLEDEMREEFLNDLNILQSLYVYTEVINRVVEERRLRMSYTDYDNYIPYYAYDFVKNYNDVKNILLYHHKIRNESKDYTKTPLERYALQKMEINYWRSRLGW